MKYIYILFSATPYRTGSFIRHMLNNRYNHVALSFDEDLSDMYTFSRHHANTPFFGGFVRESFCRYEWKGDFSDIKVCRLAISDKKYDILKKYVQKMLGESEKYVYNYYSAAVTPLHQRIRIRNAYTCVEFVGDLLGLAGFQNIEFGGFHSLQNLEKKCNPYMIFEGSSNAYPAANVWTGDDFQTKMPVSTGLAATAVAFGRLTKYGVQDAYSFVSDKLRALI